MDQVHLKKLGKNVRLIRKRRGWTQERLATLAEIHPVYVSYIEKGSRNPSISKIFRIVRALKCKPNDAFKGIL